MDDDPRPQLPLISIVTPNYQNARYLEGTLRSVFEQNYPNLECIVIDGGSTDGSIDIIRRHERRLAYWCSEPDRGISHAINKGLTRARGDVVGWLGSSDLLMPGALHQIGAAFADRAVDAVCGWHVTMDELGEVLETRIYPQPSARVLLQRHILPQQTVYWRRSVLEGLGLLDESFRVVMDLDYWMRMVEAGIVPLLIPRFQACYRIHRGQAVETHRHECLQEMTRVFSRFHETEISIADLKRQTPRIWKCRYKLMRRGRKTGRTGLGDADREFIRMCSPNSPEEAVAGRSAS